MRPRGLEARVPEGRPSGKRRGRCSYLFFALLALLLSAPFVADTASGRVLVAVINLIVLAAAVAAFAGARMWLLAAIALGVPVLVFQSMSVHTGSMAHLTASWGFAALFYLYTLAHLLHYVLHRDVMTADKLYGAVAAYVMIGITWAFVFGVVQHFYPGSFSYQGTARTLNIQELVFFSFTVLTTAGFGDITPVLGHSRMLTIFEALTGVMYSAILIARLTGVYPVQERISGSRP